MSDSGCELLSISYQLIDILSCLLVLLFDLCGVLKNFIAPLLNPVQFIKLIMILLLELASFGTNGLRFVLLNRFCSCDCILMYHQCLLLLPLLFNSGPVETNFFGGRVQLRCGAMLLHFLHEVHHLYLELLHFAFFGGGL